MPHFSPPMHNYCKNNFRTIQTSFFDINKKIDNFINNKDFTIDEKLKSISKEIDQAFEPIVLNLEKIQLNETLNSNFKLFLSNKSDEYQIPDSLTLFNIIFWLVATPFFIEFMNTLVISLWIIALALFLLPFLFIYINYNFFNKALIKNIDNRLLKEIAILKNKLFKYFSLKAINNLSSIDLWEQEEKIFNSLDPLINFFNEDGLNEFLETYKSLKLSDLSSSSHEGVFEDFMYKMDRFNDDLKDFYIGLKKTNELESLEFFENDKKWLQMEMKTIKKDLTVLYYTPETSRITSVKKQINKLENRYNFLNLINLFNEGDYSSLDLNKNFLSTPYKEDLEFKLKELIDLQIKIKNSFHEDINKKVINKEIIKQQKVLEFVSK